ncbi:MAG: DUF1732 domain-containing protein [bacterium]|jgi:uncharacterized protein (TIGR00255 family)|nr:DUF1732 domain-containing protein [bacterium]
MEVINVVVSMTGYGEAATVCERKVIRCRLKSVNGRGAKVKVHGSFLPLSVLHTMEKKIVQVIGRGEVSARITLEAEPGREDMDLIASVRKATDRLSRVKEALDLPRDITLGEIIDFQRAFPKRDNVEDGVDEEILKKLLTVIDQALEELESSRLEEGKRLEEDLLASLAVIEEKMQKIESFEDDVRDMFRERILAQLAEVDAANSISEDRLAAEVVLIADRCDIHEELVRMQSHLVLFHETLANGQKTIGKKLDFIGQEMFREISTLVGKARNAGVSQHAVVVKEHLGRLREQLRNVL